MKKLLTMSLLSLAALCVQTSQASAFWPFNYFCNSCAPCSLKVGYKQYNAFSPYCADQASWSCFPCWGGKCPMPAGAGNGHNWGHANQGCEVGMEGAISGEVHHDASTVIGPVTPGAPATAPATGPAPVPTPIPAPAKTINQGMAPNPWPQIYNQMQQQARAYPQNGNGYAPMPQQGYGNMPRYGNYPQNGYPQNGYGNSPQIGYGYPQNGYGNYPQNPNANWGYGNPNMMGR